MVPLPGVEAPLPGTDRGWPHPSDGGRKGNRGCCSFVSFLYSFIHLSVLLLFPRGYLNHIDHTLPPIISYLMDTERDGVFKLAAVRGGKRLFYNILLPLSPSFSLFLYHTHISQRILVHIYALVFIIINM